MMDLSLGRPSGSAVILCRAREGIAWKDPDTPCLSLLPQQDQGRGRSKTSAQHPTIFAQVLCLLLDPTYNIFFSEISQCWMEDLTGAGLLRPCKHFHGMNAAGTLIMANVQADWDLSNSPKFLGHLSSLPIVSHCPI